MRMGEPVQIRINNRFAAGFRGELALISHLDVMLSMDSANMHLASLTGTPVVSVWGLLIRQQVFWDMGRSCQIVCIWTFRAAHAPFTGKRGAATAIGIA